MNRRVFVTLITTAVGLAAQAALGATLSPTDDGFGYQFLSGTPLNGAPPFSNYLPAGATATGHDTKSAIKFDLSGLGLSSAQVTSASLDLYVIDTALTGFGISPSPANPMTIDLFALGAGAWSEATLSWSGFPPTTGAAYESLVISGINQIVSFDVTTLVKEWLDGAVANNGLALIANSPVGGSPSWVYAVFSSSEFQVAPTLSVVPEPGSLALALCAVPALVWYGRRRFRAGK